MDKQFFVYIMTNHNNRVLYTGVTNDLKRRVFEHREEIVEGFTKRYRCKKYYEIGEDAYAAINREKQIKGGSRAKKLQLIEAFNPGWRDLNDEVQRAIARTPDSIRGTKAIQGKRASLALAMTIMTAVIARNRNGDQAIPRC
jgi:putative endonuclease